MLTWLAYHLYFLKKQGFTMENELSQYVNEVKLYFSLLKESIRVFKSAKDVLPNSPEKEIVEKTLKEAEMKALVAEAGMAKSLGFTICPKCWPPVVLKTTCVGKNRDSLKCPSCETEYTNPGKRYGKIQLIESDSN